MGLVHHPSEADQVKAVQAPAHIEHQEAGGGKSLFYVKDCALAAMATGIKAQTLGEFRDRLKMISAESIYYHFWRQSIETSLVPGAFHNDFSRWAHEHLHDDILAERLALIDPSEYVGLDKLRLTIMEVIENRLDELDVQILSPTVEPFHFIQSKIIVFSTPYIMHHPEELVKVIPDMSRSSIFYHFIDARRRSTSALDDFSTWLGMYNGQFSLLIQSLKQIDPYFIPLEDLQQKIASAVMEYFLHETHHQGETNHERSA